MYFAIQSTGRKMKIGHSQNVKRRLSSLQCGSAAHLKILGYIEGDESTEKALHEMFKHRHDRGEWFHYDKYIKEEVMKILNGDYNEILRQKVTNRSTQIRNEINQLLVAVILKKYKN